MSFLTGKTEARPSVTGQTSGLHNELLAQFMGQQGANRLFPGTGINPQSLQPFLDLFSQQNARNFAQAKESAGNLTGSGLGNILGSEMGRASVEQSAFLANFLEQRRQADAQRNSQLALGLLGSPAAQLQYTYTPGFLDYLGQGATALAGGGAFNKFFGGGTAKAGQ